METNLDMLTKINNAIKAITVSDMGTSILNPTKQSRFIRTVSEATRVLDAARQITMQSHTYDIDRIGFAARILHAATENTDPGDIEVKPVRAVNTLESHEVIAIAGVTDSTLEDNIEKQAFEDTLLQLIAGRVGLDLEELFLQGDTASADTFLKVTDGWLKKAANQITGVASEDFDPTNVEGMFNSMIGAVPKKYLRDRAAWRFYCHWDIEDAYRDVLRGRGTGLGDSAQTTAGTLAYKGIQVLDNANMPSGYCLLVPPTNLVYGIYRDIRIEPDRIAKARRTDFVTTLRVDCNYEDENAAVVAQGYTGPAA